MKGDELVAEMEVSQKSNIESVVFDGNFQV
jgi:hypothetical protein